MTVRTDLDPTSAVISPGAAATFTLRVRNGGDTVEEYQFAIVGSLRRWTELSSDRLRLFPGDEGTVTVKITPPRASEPVAGPTPFGVQIRPREHPELVDVAEGTANITPFQQMRAEMNPVSVRGRLSATLRFTIENRGNAPLPLRLRGRDDEDALLFPADGQPITVLPGLSQRPMLRVRPRRLRFTGREQRYPFTVTVAPVDEGGASTVAPVEQRGNYTRIALIPKWLLICLIVLALLAALAALLYYVVLPALRPQLSSLSTASPPAATASPPTQIQQAEPTQTQQAEPSQTQPPAQIDNQDQSKSRDNQQTNDLVRIRQDNLDLELARDQQNNQVPAVVDAKVGSAANGGNSNRNALWRFVRAGGNAFAIVAAATQGSVLDRLNNNSQVGLTDVSRQGGKVDQSQLWILRQNGGVGATQIVNAATGECLTNAGSGQIPRAVKCDNKLARFQQWKLTRQ